MRSLEELGEYTTRLLEALAPVFVLLFLLVLLVVFVGMIAMAWVSFWTYSH